MSAEILNFPRVPVIAAMLKGKRICDHCDAEIVYGDAFGPNTAGKYLCQPCANVCNCGYDYDGTYTPPTLYPVRQPGHC